MNRREFLKSALAGALVSLCPGKIPVLKDYTSFPVDMRELTKKRLAIWWQAQVDELAYQVLIGGHTDGDLVNKNSDNNLSQIGGIYCSGA